MKYGVLSKIKKGVAMVASIALVFSAVPVIPVSAEESSTGSSGKKIKDVNLGFVGINLPANINSEEDVILSSASSFNRQGVVTKVGDYSSSAGWFYAVKDPSCGENSMEASVEGGKITVVKGYENADSYINNGSHTVSVNHKTLTEVYKNANQISVLITSQDDEVMYYGKRNNVAVALNGDSFDFCIPSGMETGLYKMYVFAENISTGTNPTYSSALGKPIDIEVVPSIKMEVYGIDTPKAGEEPDTSAVLKTDIGEKGSASKDVTVTWLDETGNKVTGKYNNGRAYTAYVNMKDFGPVYFNQNPDVYINNEKAGILEAVDGTFSLYRTFNATEAVKVEIAGAVSGSAISLKAYTNDYTNSSNYTYEWYNNLDTSLPAARDSEYDILNTDVDSRVNIKVYDKTGIEIGSSYLDIKENEMLGVDSIIGVSKTNETIKGKADGTLSGLTSGMEYSKDNSTYSQCTDNTLTGLAAGEHYIRMKSDASVVPAGIDGVYACYNIGDGKTISIIFNSNGGSNVTSITDTSYGLIQEPAVPEKEGYTFAGWYKEEGCLNAWDFDNDKAETDIILYAKWNKNQDNTGTGSGTDGTPVPGSTGTPVPGTTTKPSGTTGTWIQPSGTTSTQSPAQTQTPTAVPTQNPVQTAVPTQVPVQTQMPTAVPAQTQIPTSVPVQTAAPGDTGNGSSGSSSGEGQTTDNKTATISNVKYNISGNSVSVSNNSGIKGSTVTIPNTVKVDGKSYIVTTIEAGAFKNNKSIKEVIVGDNVTTIGTGAFKGCTKLQTVKLPSKLTTIKKNSFNGCSKLGSVTIPKTVTKIGKGAFKDCISIKSVRIGNLKKTGNNNKKLSIRQGGKEIILEYVPDIDNLREASAAKVVIGANAFQNCVKLSLVVINSQVTKIGNSTFKHCSKLRKMLVRSLKLKTVGNQALKGVNNCKISVPPVKIQPYTKLFKNKGQGKKVVVAKS